MCDFKVTAACVCVGGFPFLSRRPNTTRRGCCGLISALLMQFRLWLPRAREVGFLARRRSARRSTEMKIKDCPLEIHGTICNLSYYRSAGRNFYKRFPISMEREHERVEKVVQVCVSLHVIFPRRLISNVDGWGEESGLAFLAVLLIR